MVEEAVRNGTWIPTTPASRAARVDLSKKPDLWEAYLGGKLGSLGHGSGKEFEYSRDWESIKPIYAAYVEPLSSVPYSGSSSNLTSLSSPTSIPIPTLVNHSAPRGDDEEHRLTAEVSTSTPPSLLTRARIFLNHNSSTVPNSSSADNSRSISANVSMTELSSNSSPPTIRVAVLIAMPSPSHGSSSSATPLSASISSSKSQPTSSHPLDLSSSSPTTLRFTNDEEQVLLPHLEMGVADVVVGRSENSSTWDSAHPRREEKTAYSRGSSYAEP
jgi:hypothetical protein